MRHVLASLAFALLFTVVAFLTHARKSMAWFNDAWSILTADMGQATADGGRQ